MIRNDFIHPAALCRVISSNLHRHLRTISDKIIRTYKSRGSARARARVIRFRVCRSPAAALPSLFAAAIPLNVVVCYPLPSVPPAEIYFITYN